MTLALTITTVAALGLLGLVIALVRRQAQERDRAAACLREANDALEGRLRVRTAGLAATNDDLQREIAKRTRTEAELLANEERYRALITATAVIVWSANTEGEFDKEQPGWTAFTGQTLDELRGRRWLNAVHPDDRDHTSRVWAAARAERHAYEVAYRLRHADGTYHCMSVQGVPILNTDGTVREWVGTHTSVREVERGESADALAQLVLQIDSLPLAYLLTDATNQYVHWNPAAERTFGFTCDEVLGKRPFDVIVPVRARGLAESIFARLATGDVDAHGMFENVTKGGREIMCEWHNAPLFDDAGVFQGTLSLAQDVTARQRLGDQFRQAQKMEAIGQLAGGVAHDFNNLLTIINGYTRLLIGMCAEDTPAGEALAEVREASQRATDLTRQLLAFGRLQVLRPSVLNVNGLVTEAQKVLAKLVGDDVRLVLALAPGLGLVSADPDQIEQVLTNLCVFARESMPHGGRLTFTTEAIETVAGPPGTHAEVPPGRYVRLAVADTGYGMTDDVKAQIFEPFFSTQGVGKGTGLGLATVFGIVKQSGGHITVDSTIGAGTTFAVYLPVAVEISPADRVLPSVPQLPRGGETILLVEDERPVRALAALTLRGSGYTVLEAASAEDAVEVYKTHGPFHLLLTDVVMPGMNGRELAEMLREQEPDLRLIYMSGYTDDSRVRNGIASSDAEFLQKPFEVDDLLLKVRQVLDEAASREGERELVDSLS